MTPAQVRDLAGGHLHVMDGIDDLHTHFAHAIAAEVRRGRSCGPHMSLILPWGPVGQYLMLGELLAREGLSMRECTLFFMDEYADSCGNAVPSSHPLSFRGAAERWLGTLDHGLRPRRRNVHFPDGKNSRVLKQRISELGGVKTCFGGVGVHGHIAFNEPAPGVRESSIRRVRLNEFTRTINAIRAGVGGDLENFPREAWTLGMRECLGAQRIQLYCRSDGGLDWAKTVLRLAVLGEPGDDYPVTWIRRHPRYRVITTRGTLESPDIRLP